MESTLGYDMFVGSLADRMGLAGNVHRPGTTVVAAEDRSDSSMVVAYSISAHTVLWCDPALAEDLSELAEASRSKSLDEISTWAERAGWERAGVAQMQLLRSTGLTRPTVDPSVEIRSLDRDRSDDVALIDAFKAALPDDDRDQAELDNAELDEHMVAVVDDRGIAAFASQQPFLYADRFADIATATRPDVRGRGLGRRAVAALCDEIETRKDLPLYRCDTENHGSVRLSASLGFVPVIKVVAFKRP